MTSGQSGPVIAWFRRDLRLCDNPALTAASGTGRPLLAVFVLQADSRDLGGASRWWLHHSLHSLAASLQSRGYQLMLKAGDAPTVLSELAAATGADAIAFNRGYEPQMLEEEQRLYELAGDQVALLSFPGNVLHEPGTILTGAGERFRVFTPFWHACLRQAEPGLPLAAPPAGPAFRGRVATVDLDHWHLRPGKPDWAAPWLDLWRPGESGALAALDEFVEQRLATYAATRDRPDLDGTSRLSPRLHFGEISPRQVWHTVRSRSAGDSRIAAGAEAYLRQIGWREFALHLLHAFPRLPEAPLQSDFAHFPWLRDDAALASWQRGLTGYPLVDAGMRQLWATGWMHNRVRMVVASFLVKHLMIDWRDGAAWFRDTLVDADLANNVAGWQWVAGCGADAAPYFRVFNPVLQGRKFDPAGEYVARWVPELSRLSAAYRHAPWTASEAELRNAGVSLGGSYPRPIVDHAAARARALAGYSSMRRPTTASPRR